jgi:hypothetical protein
MTWNPLDLFFIGIDRKNRMMKLRLDHISEGMVSPAFGIVAGTDDGNRLGLKNRPQ